MEIDMNIITHKCTYTNTWFAYDDNYADEYTPHGVGDSRQEAVENLKDAMETYFEKHDMMADWYLWVSEINRIERY